MFKKGERCELKNYRPLSLSNIDYKFLAFTLAQRLQANFVQLISAEQTAYVKKRFMGENILQMQDLIEYTAKMKIPSFILFLDFQKASDSITLNFIQKTLEKIGFGTAF